MQQTARQLRLAEHPVWRSLLHMDGAGTHIQDPDFILAHTDFSAQRELDLTIDQLFGGSALCRFPARYFWLAGQLGVTEPVDPATRCPALAEFLQRAPADEIYLVFASENVASPSSMMGHVLLKLAGTTAEGRPAAHAISYFTRIDGINVPRILFESLVTGKEGYYTLSPYQEKEELYLQREQRSAWEYRLKLAPEQKRLLLLHLFELKDARLTYYFDRHNCATLTADLLSLADASMHRDGGWTSPMDVVKRLLDSTLVADVAMAPSSRWYIRMLEQHVPGSVVRKIRRKIAAGTVYVPEPGLDPETRYLAQELSQEYAKYLHDRRELSDGAYAEIRQAADESLSVQTIDLSGYKQPGLTPEDSQWRVSWGRTGGQGAMQIGFLPAAHRLEDDHRQYFSESELRLGDVTLSYLEETGDVRLDELQLFASTNLIPRDLLTGGISGTFQLGLERHYGPGLDDHLALNVNGGVGLAFEPARDVLVYGIAGAGLATADDTGYLYAEPEAGLILNEIFSMKSLVSARAHYNQLGAGEWVQEFRFTQAKYLGRRYSLLASYSKVVGPEVDAETWAVTFKYLY